MTAVDDFNEGFNGALTPGSSPAVISIDLMRAYFDPQSPLCLPPSDCLGVAAAVIAAARRRAVPVIHTIVRYGPNALDGGVFVKKIPALKTLIGETIHGQLMPEVEALSEETVIVKQYASAFFGTSLSSTLRSQGINTVIIIGTSTSGCVRATAVDAIQHGFIPLVVSDGVADRNDGVHEASLYDLQAKYAEVMDSQSIIAYIENGKTPQPGHTA
ncbi:isochorismatase [Arthrobacter alpinus]|uniref:Isochorismatase n=1 Tax=Arthrobacter alpinus TaxID=656366 RepID=A0A0M4R9F2_9MICC|nr:MULTISPECIES: isochorismatase family protein [Arthrobacter]ALE91268.1 isochorismatase [Arthrobacter alpinus]